MRCEQVLATQWSSPTRLLRCITTSSSRGRSTTFLRRWRALFRGQTARTGGTAINASRVTSWRTTALVRVVDFISFLTRHWASSFYRRQRDALGLRRSRTFRASFWSPITKPAILLVCSCECTILPVSSRTLYWVCFQQQGLADEWRHAWDGRHRLADRYLPRRILVHRLPRSHQRNLKLGKSRKILLFTSNKISKKFACQYFCKKHINIVAGCLLLVCVSVHPLDNHDGSRSNAGRSLRWNQILLETRL